MPAPKERIEEGFQEYFEEIDLKDLAIKSSLGELLYRVYRAGWIRSEAYSRRQQMDEDREGRNRAHTPPDASLLPEPSRYQGTPESWLPIAPGTPPVPAVATAGLNRAPAPRSAVDMMDPVLEDYQVEPARPSGLTIGEAQAAAQDTPLGYEAEGRYWPPAPNVDGGQRRG